MGDSKSIFASKTFWGAVISVLGKLSGVVFGVEIGEDSVAQITDLTIAAVSFGTSFIGDVLAVYGRVKATKAIGAK